MTKSFVVTGGGRGIGRAVVERLLGDGDHVVAVERDPDALAWTAGHPGGARVTVVTGDAASESVTERAADLAQAAGTFAGWSTTPPSSGTPRCTTRRPARSCGSSR